MRKTFTFIWALAALGCCAGSGLGSRLKNKRVPCSKEARTLYGSVLEESRDYYGQDAIVEKFYEAGPYADKKTIVLRHTENGPFPVAADITNCNLFCREYLPLARQISAMRGLPSSKENYDLNQPLGYDDQFILKEFMRVMMLALSFKTNDDALFMDPERQKTLRDFLFHKFEAEEPYQSIFNNLLSALKNPRDTRAGSNPQNADPDQFYFSPLLPTEVKLVAVATIYRVLFYGRHV